MSKAAVREGKSKSIPENTSDILAKLTQCCEKSTEAIEKVTKTALKNTEQLADHEERIAKLEGVSKATTTQPTSTPATDPAPASSNADDKAKSQSVVADGAPIGGALSNGPTRMYKYWDYRHKCWAGPKRDLFAAIAAGNGVWEPVWVWIKDGKIDHFLTMEEIEKYCP